jgi:zinc protease
MKKTAFIILGFGLAITAFGQTLDRSVKPKPGPAPEVKLGKTEEFTLPNGLKVFVVENHKLPVVSCNIELDIKPELEGNMAGYQDMMSELLLAGTKTRSKDKLNEEIDRIGAKINASANGLSGSGLKRYADQLFGLMSDIALNTAIKSEELEKTREKVLSGMETEKNDPDAMVRNVSAAVNFGNNHPYGEVATEESVKKITLEKCTHYYTTYFRPNVAYMAIVGDITLAEVKPLVTKYFAKWEKKSVPSATYTIPALGGNKLTKVAFAPRVAAVQSVVSVTYPVDLTPSSPDLIKVRVANTVLGGGSQGRLFLDLREKHAWTYGAYSSIKEDELGGTFSATVKCRNVVSDSSVEALLNEMKLMQTERVNDTALQNSITYLSGNFSIGLEDPSRIAQLAIRTERFHLPKDYYQNYLKNLSAVTADDVIAMSKKYIRPDHANIVVAGSKEEVSGKLARFSADGKVDFYEYSGKPMVVSEAKALPAGMTADDVYKKYIDAMGGDKAFGSIKDIKIVSTSEEQGMPLTITELKKAPNLWKEMVEVSMNGNKMVAQKEVYNGTKGWQEQMGQKADVTGDELEQIVESADISAELHPEKYGIKRTLKSMEAVDGKDVYMVEAVNAKGKKTMEYYDATNGLLVRKVLTVDGPKEPMTQISDYRNYKEVPGTNGYKVPYEVSESAQGHVMKAIVQTVEVNKGIADSEFN